MEIIPTIFEKEFSSVEMRFSQIKSSSPWIQIDVTDNFLVPEKTFELELVSKIEHSISTLWDIHLMVKEPVNWLNKCQFIDASRVYGQIEMMSDRQKFITEAKNKGLEVGLAFDINTPLDKNIPQETDYILLMARHFGFGSYPFDEKIYDRIKYFKNLGFKVAVDGGVDSQNISRLNSIGVDIIYSGHNYLQLINEKIN